MLGIAGRDSEEYTGEVKQNIDDCKKKIAKRKYKQKKRVNFNIK